MEAYAGRGAMEAARAQAASTRAARPRSSRSWRSAAAPRLTSGIWARALDARRRRSPHELVDRAVGALGAGVASAVNLLDVEAVIIGGGLGMRLGEPYVGADRARRCSRTCSPPTTARRSALAALGDLGGAIGAALLARRLT